MGFDPYARLVGGFSPNDGTIDFYLRVSSLVDQRSTVLDLGAGRASWFLEDQCPTRKNIRLLKGRVAKVIAADVDPAVLTNQASDEQLLFRDSSIDLPDSSVDVIVADYVLEHVANPKAFVEGIDRLLKPGGWFCARTPHKYSYPAILGAIIRNSKHSSVLKILQPSRNEIDVFPTVYRMNTRKVVRRLFGGWEDRTFIFRSDPAYFLGNRSIYDLQRLTHELFPNVLSGNLFVFLRKPEVNRPGFTGGTTS